MRRLLIMCATVSSLASAGPKHLPLAPLFAEFIASQSAGNCEANLKANATSSSLNQSSGNLSYPVDKFVGSPQHNHIALTLHAAVLPKAIKEKHDTVIVGRVVDGERVTLVTTLEVAESSPTDLKFIDDEWLMVTWLVARGDDLGRAIELINVKSGERQQLTDKLPPAPNEDMVAMRAYGPRHIKLVEEALSQRMMRPFL